jgi:hypothetical protein
MTKRTLLTSLFLLALSGLMLHYRIHNFMVPTKADPAVTVFDGTRFLSFILPFADVLLVTALFSFRRTAPYGYMLNGFIVILGTILMAHFSIAYFEAMGVPPSKWTINSTLPDIGIAWADFFVGKALFDHYARGA